MSGALKFTVVIAMGALLAGCQTNLESAPPVTESFIRAGRLREKTDEPTLAEGRKVFLNRCIACHALPDPARFDSERLTRIVGWMSGRAHLSPEQHEALVKYLRTVRSQALEPLR
jgi:mono/diheme cytochrome c family protein